MMMKEAVGHQAADQKAEESLTAVAPLPEAAKDQKWAVSAVLTLNAATGLVEAVTFARLGGLFAAFVTGTVVLAGLHLAAGGFGTFIPYAVAFGGFIVGAVLGGILVGRAASAVPGTLRALAGEFTVLALAVAAYRLLPQEGALVTLGLLAVGMAIQFSATKNLKVADLGPLSRWPAAEKPIYLLARSTTAISRRRTTFSLLVRLAASMNLLGHSVCS